MFDHVTFVFPSRSLAKWNGTECKSFLKSRGHVGHSKLNAKESKQMVRTMSLVANWPPPEVIPAGYSIRVDEIQVMLRHCNSLFKHLFAEPHIHPSINMPPTAMPNCCCRLLRGWIG
jgi:hypothetical protein